MIWKYIKYLFYFVILAFMISFLFLFITIKIISMIILDILIMVSDFAKQL